MTPREDLIAARHRVRSLTQRDLLRLALRMGWEISTKRGKGSHVMIRKGTAGTFVPRNPGIGTRHTILDILEEEANS